MINGKNVLCVIPARGGSVGIKGKNLQLIHGNSLVGWACYISSLVKEIDKVVISTDSQEIANEAMRNGAQFIDLRPVELSGTSVHDQQVLIHTLNESEQEDQMQYQIVVMIQPTSPLRTINEIFQCITSVAVQNKSACWTLSPVDIKFHFRKQLSMNENFELSISVPSQRVVSRQELAPTYIRNGACYVLARETLFKDPNLLGTSCGYVVSNGLRPNIDTIEDLELARNFSVVNLKSKLLEERITA